MQAVNCANQERNLSNLRMFETLLITSFNVAQKKIKRRSDKMGQIETGAAGKRKIQFKYGLDGSISKKTVLNRWYLS